MFVYLQDYTSTMHNRNKTIEKHSDWFKRSNKCELYFLDCMYGCFFLFYCHKKMLPTAAVCY